MAAAAAGKAAESSTPVKRCSRCCKKGHRIAGCTEKLCSQRNGREDTADVCSTAKEEAALAVTSKVGARIDSSDDGTAQSVSFQGRRDRRVR